MDDKIKEDGGQGSIASDMNDETKTPMWAYTMTFTEDRIADLLKAIKRLDHNGRERLGELSDALKKLEPDQKLIIYRYSREADERRLRESNARRQREREARQLEREAADRKHAIVLLERGEDGTVPLTHADRERLRRIAAAPAERDWIFLRGFDKYLEALDP